MNCPTCEYLMEQTDLECPRCKMMAAKNATSQPANTSNPVVEEMQRQQKDASINSLRLRYVLRAKNRGGNFGFGALMFLLFGVPAVVVILMAITVSIFSPPWSLIVFLLELVFLIPYGISEYRKFGKYYASLKYELKILPPAEIEHAKSLLGDDFFERKITS